jgi:hypothetical protein
MKITVIKRHDFKGLQYKNFPDKDLYSGLSNEFHTGLFLLKHTIESYSLSIYQGRAIRRLLQAKRISVSW